MNNQPRVEIIPPNGSADRLDWPPGSLQSPLQRIGRTVAAILTILTIGAVAFVVSTLAIALFAIFAIAGIIGALVLNFRFKRWTRSLRAQVPAEQPHSFSEDDQTDIGDHP